MRRLPTSSNLKNGSPFPFTCSAEHGQRDGSLRGPPLKVQRGQRVPLAQVLLVQVLADVLDRDRPGALPCVALWGEALWREELGGRGAALAIDLVP